MILNQIIKKRLHFNKNKRKNTIKYVHAENLQIYIKDIVINAWIK